MNSAPNAAVYRCHALFESPYLDEELGALDVDDKRHRVVNGHAPGPVAFGDEGRKPPAATVPHGEIDDQVEVVVRQVVHDAALLLFGGTFAVLLLFKRPIDRSHLEGGEESSFLCV